MKLKRLTPVFAFVQLACIYASDSIAYHEVDRHDPEGLTLLLSVPLFAIKYAASILPAIFLIICSVSLIAQESKATAITNIVLTSVFAFAQSAFSLYMLFATGYNTAIMLLNISVWAMALLIIKCSADVLENISKKDN